ncbi:MAG TPA: protein kinase, partial [Polyangiaceae bacterium]|nr:protein kinase [Polyangiaceae bacterium]
MLPAVKLPLVIGRYVLEGQIASGGMATVYYGRRVDENQFAKPVAIKRMHPHCARDADFVAMFLDEANLAARIRHPNVVPVLDFAAEGEDLIIVMEYLAGDTVGSLIQSAHEAKLYPPHRVV